MSRWMFDTAMTRPSLSRIGAAVIQTRRGLPVLVIRVASKLVSLPAMISSR